MDYLKSVYKIFDEEMTKEIVLDYDVCAIGNDYLIKEADNLYFKSRLFEESKVILDLKAYGF